MTVSEGRIVYENSVSYLVEFNLTGYRLHDVQSIGVTYNGVIIYSELIESDLLKYLNGSDKVAFNFVNDMLIVALNKKFSPIGEDTKVIIKAVRIPNDTSINSIIDVPDQYIPLIRAYVDRYSTELRGRDSSNKIQAINTIELKIKEGKLL